MAAIWAPLPAAELVRFGRFATELADRLEAYAASDGAPAPGRGTKPRRA